jgi:NAD(P)-dependent dehydrogenase (short-subunit alcohol dehydrogenase family)
MAVKNALITGSASGLGLRLCEGLVRRGWRVAMFSRNGPVLHEAAERLALTSPTLAEEGDVTDADAVRRFARRVETEWGPIDLAIANAGIRGITRATSFSLELAESLMRTNYFGMLHLFDAVMPGMIERRSGCFAGIASIAGVRCLAGGSAYGASKAAMQAFLDTTRLDVRGRGVQVVTVNPWFIRTAEVDDGVPRPMQVNGEWAAERILRGIEAGRTQIEFPLLPSLLWKVLRVLPNPLFVRLFGARA